MNRFRRPLSLLLALTLTLVLAACGDAAPQTPADASSSKPSAPVSPSSVPDQPSGAAPVSAVREAVYPDAIPLDDYDALLAREEENPVSEDFLTAMNRFAYQTLPYLLEDGQSNLCYSPASLYYALAVAATGAAGSTAEEFRTVLGADPETLAEQCGNLMRRMYREDELSTLLIANSLWMSEEIQGTPVQYQEGFIERAVDHFYASLFQADFSDPATGDAIARWIHDNTGGLLSFTPPVSEQMLLSIVNTIYLKAQWSDPFDQESTAPDTFTRADGEALTCDFMHQTDSGSYFRGNHYLCAERGLSNGGKMTFVLPDKGVDATSLLRDASALEAMFSPRETDPVLIDWSLPKFTFDTQLFPEQTLQQLGMENAFTPAADFSALSDQPACISSIVQGTHLAVDEDGVEAAAYTFMGVEATSMLPPETVEMNLNRPFLFAITSPEGAPLFLGICGDPAA